MANVMQYMIQRHEEYTARVDELEKRLEGVEEKVAQIQYNIERLDEFLRIKLSDYEYLCIHSTTNLRNW